MDAFLQLLLTPGLVEAIAVLILIIAAAGYWGWFAPSVKDVREGLQRLTESLRETIDQDWDTVRERAGRLVANRAALNDLWQETEGRVSRLRIGDKTVAVMFGSPRDLWSARNVLARRFNLDLSEVIPNILVGVGLLFTFIFLTAALTSTTAALTGTAQGSGGVEVVTDETTTLVGDESFVPDGQDPAINVDSPDPAPAAVSPAPAAVSPAPAAVSPAPAAVSPARADSGAVPVAPPAAVDAAPVEQPSAVSSDSLVAPDAGAAVAETLLQAEADAIAARSASQKTEDAIRDLLKVAGSKFLTSLTGLLASLLWMFAAKRSVNGVEIACDELLLALALVVPTNGGEKLVEQQLAIGESSLKIVEQQLQAYQSNLKLVEQQLETSQNSLQKVEEGLEQGSELLVEAREQTGALKRFETDLAVSLAGAINPQMQAMTDRLVGAIDSLSQRLSSMNQDALEKMLADFSGMIRDATKTEMTEMKEALGALSSQLNSAGQTIGDNAAAAVKVIGVAGEAIETQSREISENLAKGAAHFASSLNEAGGSIVEQSREISENLTRGAAHFATSLSEAGDSIVAQSKEVASHLAAGASSLEQATGSLRLAMNELDATVTEAKASGREGIAVVRTVIDQTGDTVQRLGTVSNGLIDASSAIETVSGKLAGIMEDVEELSREQRAVVRAVQEVAPQASAAVERVSTVLDQAAKQTMTMMQQAKQSMDATALALGKTVSSITEGVNVYTKDVAELHRNMDSHLARAVGSLDKGISGLTESVEELSEVMESSAKRAR